MSDLDEPPAKVLKIDNINGVTHVTELSGFPEPYEGVVEGELLGEESGIIEGGAEPEGQEEWLSEGILTDDDFNPASQETINDKNNYQLGTSHEEEHLDSTIDSEANAAENEANLTENEANLTENEANMTENEANLTENEANLTENEANLTENDPDLTGSDLAETSMVESEQNGMEIDGNISLEDQNQTNNETNLSFGEENISTTEANITKSDTSMADSVTKLMEMSNFDTDICESQTFTQQSEANSVSGTASDIVIQRVITVNKNPIVKEIESKTEMNIEETMKNFERDDFDSLLKRNTDVKGKVGVKAEANQEQDDGNDTDDLLRMLEEDDSKSKKKLTKNVKDILVNARDDDSTDDDDDNFVYQGSGIKSLKAAHAALTRKQPASKAIPEDSDGDDEREGTVEEAKTVQRMFGFKSGSSVLRQQKPVPANILNIVEKPQTAEKPKQYHNKRMPQSLLKPTTPSAALKQVNTIRTFTNVANQGRTNLKSAETRTQTPLKPAFSQKSTEKNTKAKTFGHQQIKTEIVTLKTDPGSMRSGQGKIRNETSRMRNETGGMRSETGKMRSEARKMRYEAVKIKTEEGMIAIEPGKMRVAPEEIIDEEEYLDEVDYGLDEDELIESDNDVSQHRQRIMRPEMMDEEVPSDADSASEDASLYDEMPSSDSDDMEDWFQLDIRSEKASDYLPLLGPKAKELLTEEKRRVAARLSTLRQSHTALSASGKQQAAILRRATAALAEIDDMLRAA